MSGAMDVAAIEEVRELVRKRVFFRPLFADCRGTRARRKSTTLYLARAHRAETRSLCRVLRLAARTSAEARS